MNILFVSTKSPYPLKDGHSLRTFNLLKQASKNNNIFLLTYFLSKEEVQEFDSVQAFTKRAEGYALKAHNSGLLTAAGLFLNLFSPNPFVVDKFNTRRMRNAIKKILREEKIDVVHMDLLPLMGFYKIIKQYPIVLVNHNVESALLSKRVKYTKNLFTKLYLLLQYYKLRCFEKKQIGRVACCVAVSDKDRDILQTMQPSARIEVVPNGVDTDYFKPHSSRQENTLIYVGGMDWFPNSDAVNYFSQAIYPKILEHADIFNVEIIGKIPKNYNNHNVFKYYGYIKDVRPYLEKAKVFIVPLRIGGGTRLKILDAMSMERAIVTTSIGCEGLEVENGTHLIIEDTAEGFAKAVVELLGNDVKRQALGANARKLVQEKYAWETIALKMDKIYTTLRR